MKRHGNLYEKIIERQNLELAFEKAAKGKNWQSVVKNARARKDELIDELQAKMLAKQYKTSEYKTKIIYEPKMRTIYVLPFYPDRIVQHAIMNVLEPIWEKLFVYDSYACRKGKGQHKGSIRCMEFVRRNSYCLKCDVSKFYPSINHNRLLEVLAKKIKCQDTLKLLKDIIESIPGESNVPIGNYLSQWFGNLYLNELDMVVKHDLHIKDYLRYCDDFLLFGTKEKLIQAIPTIKDCIENSLKMKLSKCDLFSVTRGVDFLGYRHFPNGYVLLRKSTAKRVKKRMRGIVWNVKHGKSNKDRALSSIGSTMGWLKWANTHNLSMAIKLAEVKKEIEQIQ